MNWISDLFELIQQHKFLYVLVVGIVLGIINAIIFFVQKKADKYSEGAISSYAKRNHIIVTLLICILAAIIPLVISTYYPYSEPTSTGSESIGTNSEYTDSSLDYVDTTSKPADTSTETNYDGYLKLSFFNGRFAYRTYVGQKVYNASDVIEVSDRSYFYDSISPLVYITIIDDSNQVVYDSKSEHLNSCLIGIDYGTYTLIASCENYKKYTTTITLTPQNKTTDIWQHNIFFIPDEYVATDLQIQIVDKEGRSINNCEVSIGYTGFTLTEEVDETGILNELFTLAKGEYLIYIDSLDLYGRFYVNELTNDKSIIVVTLE